MIFNPLSFACCTPFFPGSTRGQPDSRTAPEAERQNRYRLQYQILHPHVVADNCYNHADNTIGSVSEPERVFIDGIAGIMPIFEVGNRHGITTVPNIIFTQLIKIIAD